MLWQIIGLSLLTYLIAAIPFSLVVGYLVTGKDIRKVGDGNPGATNVKRATGSLAWYSVALLLDGFKGLFPVGILYWIYDWRGAEIIPIAIAALLGHSFSIYLGFKGGKAVAITGGVWTGLILFEAPVLIAVSLVLWYWTVEEDEWAVILMMLTLGLYLLLTRATDGVLWAIWGCNLVLILFTHRKGLTGLPTLKKRTRKG